MQKKCFKCGEIKQVSEFYKHSEMGDKHLNKCKKCTRRDTKINSKGVKKRCVICNKKFGTCVSEVNRGGGKFCSRECFYKSNSGKNVYNYKGVKASYSAKHRWIKRILGNPNYCEHCKKTDKKCYHWSNISGKYKRKVSDWQRLCVKCHSEYDNKKAKRIIVVCIICNKNIKTISKKRKFCSKGCSNKYYKNKYPLPKGK